MNVYEKLGAFYLGKSFDMARQKREDQVVLYDAKDLLTHAVIIGMTGSGKTGLGIAMLEEALIDNIPVIAIDPKGDLPNLLLNFPALRPEDFRPWINIGEAAQQGVTPEQMAARTAKLWREGLAEWDQTPERIGRLGAAAEFVVYTPGSTSGLPVNVLRSFAPPSSETRTDGDLLREKIQSTVTALLALVGIEGDPITSREHILLANIFEQTWAAGKALDLPGLIAAVQQPPMARVGVMDLASFYPPKDRFQLAMRLNNLLASPGFDAWLTGETLDIERMLYTAQGKPRALIFSINHLSDAERMFFVSVLLNEILGWIRTQAGTASLRTILYMDEIYGYFPPVKNPPSKAPLLTLLKQARAYGLGVVLSTQNPVDLDYKGLANTGTWFIGRLQTENDKQRLMSGLEGAGTGAAFDQRQMGELLAGLGKRIFLMHNVHENAPTVFQTRWVLSYLSGPMTREQIKMLPGPDSGGGAPASAPAIPSDTGASAKAAQVRDAGGETATVQPPDVSVFYLQASGAGQGLVYLPAVGGWLEAHYMQATYGVDIQQSVSLAALLEDGPLPFDWDQAVAIPAEPADLSLSPPGDAVFGVLPAAAMQPGAFKKWGLDFLRWFRQNRPVVLYQSRRFKQVSAPHETEGIFRARLAQTVREERDLAVEKIRRRYAEKYAVLNDRLRRAEQVLAREREQSKTRKVESVISFGTAILGAFLGRKAVSASSVSRVGTAMKSAGRLSKEQMDVARAQETVEAVRHRMAGLEERLQKDIDKLEAGYDPADEVLRELRVRAKGTDLNLKVFGLLWLPYRRDAAGRLAPDWSLS